jgi:endonuclease YncB( thermonuclease family)
MRWYFLLCGVLLLAAPAHSASVLSIGDGDTITVTEGSQRIKVRLACIDAP